MLNLTLPLQDYSLPSNLLTVHKMELVFSFGTQPYFQMTDTYHSLSTQLSICSTLKCKIENTIIEMEHTI